jgi:hypothetical protein
LSHASAFDGGTRTFDREIIRQRIRLGGAERFCDRTSFLLSSVDIPVESEILEASEQICLPRTPGVGDPAHLSTGDFLLISFPWTPFSREWLIAYEHRLVEQRSLHASDPHWGGMIP